MYMSEYDACDVTLSVYPHRASLKNMPGHGLPMQNSYCDHRNFESMNQPSPVRGQDTLPCPCMHCIV
jgi:hypothetical protein